MITVKGIIRTTSPLFIAAPGDARYDFDNRTFGTKNGVPCTRVRQERVVAIESDKKEDSAEFVPVIPGNSIRGMLRRQVAEIVLEAVNAKGDQKVSLDVYHTLTCGAATGSPDTTDRLSVMRKAMDHPFIGLFGGTNKMIPSVLRVYTGYPACPATAAAKMISPEFAGYQAKTDWLLMVDMFLRKDDIDGNIPPSFTQSVADPDETITKWFELIEDKSTKAKQAADSEVEDGGRNKMKLRNWGARELVAPGVPFEIGFAVESYDYAKTGLLLLGLERLLKKGCLGGRTAIGYGRFRAEAFTLEENVDGDSCSPFKADGSLDRDNDLVLGYIAAAQEFLEKVNVQELEELCNPGATPDEKAEKKKGKKKVEKEEGGE